MAFLLSGHTESNNRSPALIAMPTGLPRMGYACAGSRLTLALGSESSNLPALARTGLSQPGCCTGSIGYRRGTKVYSE